MLKRRPGETLTQLLTRLDQAIERAWTEEIYTDEINPPPSHKRSAPAAHDEIDPVEVSTYPISGHLPNGAHRTLTEISIP
jgi:hypothetical protein